MEIARLLNEVIPKPSLNGVAPDGLHKGVSSAKIEANRQYLEHEREKENGGNHGKETTGMF